MASVDFRNVGKSFPGGVVALRDFTISIADGEFLVLVGPSGCGKSTCLRILAGLEDPTTGRVLIDGQDVTETLPQERDVAMVFQNYALYPHMSVFDNLSFALKMRKVPREETRRRVEEAAEVLDISSLLNRKPRELSGGQRQRVALGRAIVRKPAVFLFDEPLSNLDAKLRVQMRSELSRLHTSLGATMIHVTHDQAEAMTLGDRIVVLESGSMQQVATPMELYEKPVNAFVAGFVGSPAMNFISLQGGDEALSNATERFRIELHVPPGAVLLGIRPEDVVPDHAGKLECVAEVVEVLGNEKIVYMKLGSGTLVMRCEPSTPAVVGGCMRVGFRTGHCHYFGDNGERLSSDD